MTVLRQRADRRMSLEAQPQQLSIQQDKVDGGTTVTCAKPALQDVPPLPNEGQQDTTGNALRRKAPKKHGKEAQGAEQPALQGSEHAAGLSAPQELHDRKASLAGLTYCRAEAAAAEEGTGLVGRRVSARIDNPQGARMFSGTVINYNEEAGNHMVDFDEDQERYWLDQEEERQAGNLVWLQTTPEEAAAWAELRAEREIAALIRQEYAQALAEVARLQGE